MSKTEHPSSDNPPSGVPEELPQHLFAGLQVLLVAADGSSEPQLAGLREPLEALGAAVTGIALPVRSASISRRAPHLDAGAFDGVLLAGSREAAAALFQDPRIAEFLKFIVQEGKPVLDLQEGTPLPQKFKHELVQRRRSSMTASDDMPGAVGEGG